MLIAKIKEMQLAARKARLEIDSALLTTLLSEASAPGKNAGNRESTNDEVVAVVKKFIKNIDETLKALEFNSDDRVAVALREKEILEDLLPTQLSEGDIRHVLMNEIRGLEDKSQKQMGKLMATLKANYGGRYDGALASKIVKELLN